MIEPWRGAFRKQAPVPTGKPTSPRRRNRNRSRTGGRPALNFARSWNGLYRQASLQLSELSAEVLTLLSSRIRSLRSASLRPAAILFSWSLFACRSLRIRASPFLVKNRALARWSWADGPRRAMPRCSRSSRRVTKFARLIPIARQTCCCFRPGFRSMTVNMPYCTGRILNLEKLLKKSRNTASWARRRAYPTRSGR